MEERKRFQKQTLNSEDYEKTVQGAQAIKNGGIVLSAVALVVGVGKKYGPKLLMNISKFLKV